MLMDECKWAIVAGLCIDRLRRRPLAPSFLHPSGSHACETIVIGATPTTTTRLCLLPQCLPAKCTTSLSFDQVRSPYSSHRNSNFHRGIRDPGVSKWRCASESTLPHSSISMESPCDDGGIENSGVSRLNNANERLVFMLNHSGDARHRMIVLRLTPLPFR
jgi:hypothetical protein